MNWIKRRRKELRLSQQELADRLQLRGIDVSRATVSHWESEIRFPAYDDPAFTNALAEVLRMSVVAVLIEAGYRIARDGVSEAAKRAADIVDRMPPTRQELALGILEQLASEK